MKLTPKMVQALEAIKANGGRVGNWLDAYKAIGANGHAINALLRRGALKRAVIDGSVYVVLSTD